MIIKRTVKNDIIKFYRILRTNLTALYSIIWLKLCAFTKENIQKFCLKLKRLKKKNINIFFKFQIVWFSLISVMYNYAVSHSYVILLAYEIS